MALGRAEVEALVREARAAIEIGNRGAALLLLHRAESLAPSPAGWRAIADAWHAAGDAGAGGKAHLRAARASERDPELASIAEKLGADDLDGAEAQLIARLADHPNDIAALRLRALLAVRRGDIAGAEALIARALELAPGYAEAQRVQAMLRGEEGP